MNQQDQIKLSIIVPVYNRPVEMEELLESLVEQTSKDFELVVVEDGSEVKSDQIVETYQAQLTIQYFFKPNSGPGQSRNYGFERASGNYCIFLDSDCVLPPDYVEIVLRELKSNYTDAFGGPDRAHKDFSNLQKSINYSMTAFLTTGGIRGGGEKLDKFYPRSFNMGYSRDVFDSTGGFAKMRFGEDIDMSIRILKNNFTTKLFKDAWVYHKRRTSFRQFYKQIYNSGIARINLYKRHPASLKLVHLAPAVFTIGVFVLLIASVFISKYALMPLVLHMLLLFLDSSIKNKNPLIGLQSIVTSYIQLMAYGFGFINAFFQRIVFGKSEFAAFNKNFYK